MPSAMLPGLDVTAFFNSLCMYKSESHSSGRCQISTVDESDTNDIIGA